MQRITDSVINGAIGATKRITKVMKFSSTSSNTASKQHKRFKSLNFSKSTKRLLQVSSLTIAGIGIMSSVPANSDTGLIKQNLSPIKNEVNNTEQVYNRVLSNKKLILASVEGDSTFFAIDGFQHGFGYDLARSYANDLGVDLVLKTYLTSKAALTAINTGEADMALTTASTQLKSELSVATINLSCGRDAKLTGNGLHPKVSWSFSHSGDRLAQSASHYLCDNDQIDHTKKLAHFYNQNLLKDAYNQMHFEKALTERLPNYKSSFKSQAKRYNHDWELLVAMGYQESHLKANAISPTGVQGIMMLTNDTAAAMGVTNRVDPSQSIRGGARYLEMLKEKFSDVPKADRTWFALAAYNMGPYAVKDIQEALREQGKDENSWANIYAYLSDNAKSNGRYVQCMHYVSNIRSYLESIKTQTV